MLNQPVKPTKVRHPFAHNAATGACLALVSLMAVGLAATPLSAEGVRKTGQAVKGDPSAPNIVYPRFGSEAPQVAVVFDAPYGKAQRAAIYVAENGAWRLVHQGDYNRGSMLSGKGGMRNRYRMITTGEDFADLSFAKGNLVLTGPKMKQVLYSVGS